MFWLTDHLSQASLLVLFAIEGRAGFLFRNRCSGLLGCCDSGHLLCSHDGYVGKAAFILGACSSAVSILLSIRTPTILPGLHSLWASLSFSHWEWVKPLVLPLLSVNPGMMFWEQEHLAITVRCKEDISAPDWSLIVQSCRCYENIIFKTRGSLGLVAAGYSWEQRVVL